MKNFVDSKWLIEHIKDENLVILDARAGLTDPLEGINSYKESHIKGAHFVSLEDISTGAIALHGGRHPLPDFQKFKEDMEKLGISDSSKVIIYDDGTIAMASRLWWLLKYIGKEDVYILEGGKKAFIDNGGETTTEIPIANENANLSLNINKDMNVEMEYVKSKIDDKDTAIVDARAHGRYLGEYEPLDPIPGHIKNAINYPWTELVDDGKIIDLQVAKENFKDLKDYKELIIHCGSGITGIVPLLILDEIGINSKLYAGGYSDWLSYKDNEVVQGKN